MKEYMNHHNQHGVVTNWKNLDSMVGVERLQNRGTTFEALYLVK